jgi:hypothetical protein
MNSKLVIFLGSACVLLTLIIAAEWFYANWLIAKLLTPLVIKTRELALDEMPSIDLLKRQQENYVDLVTRPLFIKGRRPVSETRDETIPSDVPQADFDWQLLGVFTSQRGLYALVSRDKRKVPKDNYRKITLKQNIDLKNKPGVKNDLDGWNLSQILKDRIILKQGASQKELLLKKGKPKLASTDANAAFLSDPMTGQPSDIPPPGVGQPVLQPPEMSSPANTLQDVPPEPMPQPTDENIENNPNVQF